MIPIETEVINSLIISCMNDTLFKIILKESPEFRNKLIALILDIDIEIVNQLFWKGIINHESSCRKKLAKLGQK